MMKTPEHQTLTPKDVLVSSGFTEVIELPQQKTEIFLFTAKKDGRHVFVKGSVTPQTGIDRIENQVLTDHLLHGKGSESGVETPNAKLIKNNGFSFAVMEYIAGTSVGESRPDGLNEKLSEADIQSIVNWLVAVRQIPTTDIPEHFQTIATNHWNKDFYAKRLEQNTKEPIALGMLSETEIETLKQLWENHFGLLTFQHHDVVPFNLFRGQDKKLHLIDGEFARLGMAGYDAAYFALQTYSLYGDHQTAALMLEKMLKAWHDNFPNDHMDTAILAPLAYRIVANLNDAPTKNNTKVRARTVFLKDLILSGDVQKLIDGLQQVTQG